MECSEQRGNSMKIGKPFEKGQSGNPGGRPKVVAQVRELAREHTAEAIQTLVSIMTDPKSAPAARVSAANALLDRGYGKPPQHVTGENANFVAWMPRECETAEEWMAMVEPRKALTNEHATPTDESST
jgi:Family of unknown function (DUF5681)